MKNRFRTPEGHLMSAEPQTAVLDFDDVKANPWKVVVVRKDGSVAGACRFTVDDAGGVTVTNIPPGEMSEGGEG